MNVFFVIVNIVTFPIKMLCYLLIYIYKFLISPILPKSCIYYPTCSSYMLNAIKEFGIITGVFLGTKRLLRCGPWHEGGIDLVPYNIRGEKAWIF